MHPLGVFLLVQAAYPVDLPKKENAQQGTGDEENERLNLKMGDVSIKGERYKTRRDNAQESDSPNPGAEARQLPLESAELRGKREKQNDDCASYQPSPRGAGCEMHVVLLSSLKGTGHTQHSVKAAGLGWLWVKCKDPASAGCTGGVLGCFPDGRES